MKSLLLLVFGILACQTTAALSTARKCQIPTISANYKDPKVLKCEQRKAVHKVWDSNVIPEMSCNAERLVDVLIKMADSNNPDLLNISYQISSWASIHLPYADHCESMCIIPKLVEASKAWLERKDCVSAADAITSWSQIVGANCLKISQITLKLAGCTPLPESPLTADRCDGNGFVYDIQSVWRLFGKSLPRDLIKLATLLYKSSNYVDKLMAAITVGCIVPVQSAIFDLHPPQYVVENIMLACGGDLKIEPCCCPALKKKLLEVCSCHVTAANNNAKYLINGKYKNHSNEKTKPQKCKSPPKPPSSPPKPPQCECTSQSQSQTQTEPAPPVATM